MDSGGVRVSYFPNLPPGERFTGDGRRVCRWCPQVMSGQVEYISVRTKRRLEQLFCPKCDMPDKPGVVEGSIDKWREEFGL